MAAAGTAPVATAPVVRALLDHARSKGYTGGVLGVRARPVWDGPVEFEHQDVLVRVVACVSTLAVREALLDRDPVRWLVVVTDREDSDLGAGVLSHLIWHRLRTPDPWDAVRTRFAATGIDPRLTIGATHREVAAGLLAATPQDGWPPAAGGVLTRDHALGAVARGHLRAGVTGADIDVTTVLQWTATADASRRIADLRALAGDALTDEVLAWLSDTLGTARTAVNALLSGGSAADVVPIGLVAGLIAPDPAAGFPADALRAGREALIRLEPRLGGRTPDTAGLRIWAVESGAIVAGLLLDPGGRSQAERLVTSADALLHELRAEALAEHSELFPSGLAIRLARMAEALRTAVPATGAHPGIDDAPLVATDPLARVERAWLVVTQHRLADGDRSTDAFRAALRLVRWLAVDASASGGGLTDLVQRHRDADAWVDAAVSDAAPGVGDSTLAEALTAVIGAARRRRGTHDPVFAAALAAHTEADASGVSCIEDLIPSLVLPLAKRTPVLLLVLDGMSVAVATEVTASVLDRVSDGWIEAVAAGTTRRGAVLSVLPSLTEFSRTSLLAGELARGHKEDEVSGLDRLLRAHSFARAPLFHKPSLDRSNPGQAVASDVGEAIDDVAGSPLVTCVLNTIDDALDRSDPGGIHWDLDAVKHLRPLLERARRAGRTVVLTADHGHVIERRQGQYRAMPEISSARSRLAIPPAGEGEVLITGRRVLTEGGRAVLAVDEGLRYSALKAGYHGGASPAEVMVPVCILVPGVLPADLLNFAPPQEPVWWWSPVHPVDAASAGSNGLPAQGGRRPPAALPLFPEPEPGSPGGVLVAALVASATYRGQRRAAGRTAVSDEKVRDLLTRLVDAEGHRLGPQAAALALGEPQPRLSGAVSQVQRLLNVEGYAVLRRDPDGATLVLDVALLREQFALTE